MMLRHLVLGTSGFHAEMSNTLRNILVAALNESCNLADGNRFTYTYVGERLVPKDGRLPSSRSVNLPSWGWSANFSTQTGP